MGGLIDLVTNNDKLLHNGYSNDGVVSGGFYFEWTDEWWKADANNPEYRSMHVGDPVFTGHFPGCAYDHAWFGLNGISLKAAGSTSIRSIPARRSPRSKPSGQRRSSFGYLLLMAVPIGSESVVPLKLIGCRRPGTPSDRQALGFESSVMMPPAKYRPCGAMVHLVHIKRRPPRRVKEDRDARNRCDSARNGGRIEARCRLRHCTPGRPGSRCWSRGPS